MLLCHKYREAGKIKTKVLANLSHLPEKTVLLIENSLKHNSEALVYEKDIAVERSIDIGLFLLSFHLMNKLRISEIFEKVMPEQASLLKLLLSEK